MSKKKKQCNQKMGHARVVYLNTFFQRIHTDSQKVQKKLLNITISEMQSKTTPHTSQNGHHQKVYKQ